MIIGVGVDVCDISRFAESLRRTPELGERLFTADERGRADASLAARFAAKEALAKALGGGEQPLGEPRGAPQRRPEPSDVADVDADADDHSTVTDLARLRGWSTS